LSVFTKRFNHTAVVFFSGNNKIKHINRHFIGTKMVKTEKISKTRDLQVARDRKSVLCCCLFCACEVAGCWDEWVHRTHEAGCLPPFKGLGLGLTPQGAPSFIHVLSDNSYTSLTLYICDPSLYRCCEPMRLAMCLSITRQSRFWWIWTWACTSRYIFLGVHYSWL